MGMQDLSGALPQPRLAVCETGVIDSPWPTPGNPIIEGAENCLRHNPYLALKNVRCEYREGILTLRGCVPSYYLKQMAQTAVAQIGVQNIVNEIEVISAGRR